MRTLMPYYTTTSLTMAAPSHHTGGTIDESRTRTIIQLVLDSYKIPGAVVQVSQYGQVVLNLAQGYEYRSDMLPSNLQNRALTTSVNFRIGSITKSMTATCILILCERNQLNLTDKLGKWFPQAPNGHKISIIQLLNMTSGLGDYETNADFGNIWFVDPKIHWNKWDLIRWGANVKPTSNDPGMDWHYCNTGYIYLGMIVEHICQQPLHVVFKTLLFDPLGMNHSFLATDAAIPEPHGQGFGNVRDKLENVTEWSPGWAWAAGGVVSNIDDLTKWAKNLGEPQLLSRYRQPMTLNYASLLTSNSSTIGTSKEHHFNAEYFYGFGLLYDHHWVWHNGSIPGWESIAAYHIPSKISIAININQSTLPENHSSESPVTEMFRYLVEAYTPYSRLHPKE